MPKFISKPTEVEAIQLQWKNWNDVCDFLGRSFKEVNPNGAWEIPESEVASVCGEQGPTFIAFHVQTIHGDYALVTHGDYIVREPQEGRFYPCRPDIFEARYAPA